MKTENNKKDPTAVVQQIVFIPDNMNLDQRIIPRSTMDIPEDASELAGILYGLSMHGYDSAPCNNCCDIHRCTMCGTCGDMSMVKLDVQCPFTKVVAGLPMEYKCPSNAKRETFNSMLTESRFDTLQNLYLEDITRLWGVPRRSFQWIRNRVPRAQKHGRKAVLRAPKAYTWMDSLLAGRV